MSFKKILKRKFLARQSGQSIVEYIVLFVILAAMGIAVFGGFSPDALRDKFGFNQAVSRAIAKINE